MNLVVIVCMMLCFGRCTSKAESVAEETCDRENGASQCEQKSAFSPRIDQFTGKKMSNQERTFIMVKPDGVHRGLVGEIIKRFEQRGYKLVGLKFMQASQELLEKHYADLSSKPFFPGLVKYMSSGPVCPMVWEGKDVVKQGRAMLGATNPLSSNPGTIRGDFCIDIGRNICHGSDAVESANKEIDLWFKNEELVSFKQSGEEWVYE